MSEVQVNERVGALLEANAQFVRFLGYGVYVGDEVPPNPPAMTGFATWEDLDEALADRRQEIEAQGQWPVRPTNPKIVLDNGDVVWGAECWWGPEEEIKAQIEHFRAASVAVFDVTIAEARAVAG